MTSDARGAVLVTGGTGQVGHELVRELAAWGPVIAPRRSELDLARPESIREAVRRVRPRVIVNAAAYTAVDRAELDRELCHRINADAPAVLAEEAVSAGAILVHFSTDYVFDGAKGAPYVETDPPAPRNWYGATKLEGERAIEAVGGAFVILRTSWLYGARGNNFLRTMLRLARERSELRIVDDQVGAPTSSRAVAGATAALLDQMLSTGPSACAEKFGTYHLTAAGQTTWYGFARAILDGDPRRSEQVCRAVVPVSTAEYPTPACRPRYSVLDSSKVARAFGLRLPGWEDQLRAVLGELARQ